MISKITQKSLFRPAGSTSETLAFYPTQIVNDTTIAAPNEEKIRATYRQ